MGCVALRTRREIEQRMGREVDAFVIDVLKWVLANDCAFCSMNEADRRALEVELKSEEVSTHYADERHGWNEGTAMTHLTEHIEYSVSEASHIEEARKQSIDTLDTAESIVNRIMGYLDELDELKSIEGISSEFVSDATRLIGQANASLKLVGQLKKEIGVDSQLLLAEARMDSMSRILVESLRNHPDLLDDVELRMSSLKTPTYIETEFEVIE
tara:strand:+ start:6843 stop:7484 length:642 start_codon:yes stop_codon:yes gene_type:complete